MKLKAKPKKGKQSKAGKKPVAKTRGTRFMTDLPENHRDLSGEMLSPPAQRHIHPVNAGVHPGTAQPRDWEPGGPEVPARPTRPLIQPDNSKRRAPSHTVMAITSEAVPAGGDTYSAHAGNHLSEPVPGKL
jgi:hypothetical protein